MKFALFTTNLAGGGAEKALAKIGSGLAARGHLVDFIVCEASGHYPIPAACRFHTLASRANHGWLGKRFLAWQLNRLIYTLDPDLLVSTLPFADEVAVLAGASRHVCRIANTLSAEIALLAPARRRARIARYHRLYAGRPLVGVSAGVAADMMQAFGIDARKIQVISNPFDFDSIRALACEPCAQRPTVPYVIHVGRHTPQKRHDLLLQAFAGLDIPHNLVLLTAPDIRLREMVAAAGLERRVIIADFQVNPYPWIAGSELLVLCSDHEGLPNVLIEALACGTRVVSTDCPSGPREILRGSLARGLVRCGDPGALAAAMRAALAAPPPELAEVEAALAPYIGTTALNSWETIARSFAPARSTA